MLTKGIKINLFLIIYCDILMCVVVSKKLWTATQQNNAVIISVTNIAKSCEETNEKPFLIAGLFGHVEIQFLSEAKQFVVFDNLNLINHSSNPRVETFKVDPQLTNHYILLNSFETMIISTKSPEYLKNALMQVKETPWWYRLRRIIIFDKFSSNNCAVASELLLIAWEADLLNAIFVCSTLEKSVEIITFNSYANWAPNRWKIVENKTDDNRRWYLYALDYRPGFVACETIFFDKTRRLDKTRIKAIRGNLNHQTGTITATEYDIKIIFDSWISEVLISQLDLGEPEWILKNLPGTFTPDGEPRGTDTFVANKSADILFDHRYLVYTQGLIQPTSFLGLSGINYIVHKRPNVPILIEIIRFFRPIVILFTMIVLGLTIIVLKFSIHESFGTAAIEVFRLFFNGPILRVPSYSSSRIFLCTILLFILIMQTILRSKILSFITAPKSNDLETFDDLASMTNYKIYCATGFHYGVPVELEERCIIKPWLYLSSLDKIDHHTVVIDEDIRNIGMAHKHKMQLSKEFTAQHYVVYRMRRNWPLAGRVNEVIMRLFEHHHVSYIMHQTLHYVNENHCNDKKTSHSVNRKILNLNDLGFAFGMLVFGLNCALVCFLIEIRFWKWIH